MDASGPFLNSSLRMPYNSNAIRNNWKIRLLSQMVKNPPAMWETWVWSLGWKDPLEKGTATHSSILAWRIPWTEEPGRLQSTGSQRVRHDWTAFTTASASYITSLTVLVVGLWFPCPPSSHASLQLLFLAAASMFLLVAHLIALPLIFHRLGHDAHRRCSGH